MQLPHNHHSDHENNISAHIPESYDFKSVSDIFKLLGDYNRIKILWLLYHTEECVINIAAMMNMSSPAASHHLKILKSAGLIEGRKEGKEMYYKASDTPESASLHFMIEEMMKISCPHAD